MQAAACAAPVLMNSPPRPLASAGAAAHQRAAVLASSPVLLQTAGELFRVVDATKFVFRGVPLDAGGLASPPSPAAQPRGAPAASAEALGPREFGLATAQWTGAQTLAQEPVASPAAVDLAQRRAVFASTLGLGHRAQWLPQERATSPAAAAQSWRGGSIFGPSPPGSPLPVLTLPPPPAGLGLGPASGQGAASGQGPASGLGSGQGPSPGPAPAAYGSAFQLFSRPQVAPGLAHPRAPAQAPSAGAWTGSAQAGSGRAQARPGAAQAWWPQRVGAGAAALDFNQFYGGGTTPRGGPASAPGQALGAAQAYLAVNPKVALLQAALRAGGSAQAAQQGFGQGPAAAARGAPAALRSVPVESGSVGARGSGTESCVSAAQVGS